MPARCTALALLLLSNSVAHAAPLNPTLHELAVRFRPYIKTTRDHGHGETIRPSSWRWFVERTSLVIGYQPTKDFNCLAGTKGTDDQWPDGSIVARRDGGGLMDHVFLAQNNAAILDPDGADASKGKPDAPAVNQGYALHLDDKSSNAQGEPWPDVVANGDGVYAHAEEILDGAGMPSGQVNIEYSVLWPYNRGICSYHHGDITTMTIVYDRRSDLITRLAYSAHGAVFQEFVIAPFPQVRIVTLKGKDDDGNEQSVVAAQVLMQSLVEAGDDHFTPGDAYIYLAQDPDNGRFEHPVAYAEYNSHEFWPNPTGKELTVAAHSGDGFSFLTSAKLEDLGTVDAPTADDAPFLFFNGAWGTDPRPIIQHRTWFWPHGRDYNPYGIKDFTDPDPYTDDLSNFKTHYRNGSVPWPPSPGYVSLANAVVYVDPATRPDKFAAFNDAMRPFSDLTSALSFLPYGGTVIMAAGKYAGPRLFDRPSIMRSSAPVTFGTPN